MSKELKDLKQALPAQLKTALSKFPLNKPDGTIPDFISERANGKNDEDLSFELSENQTIEVAEWAFEKSGKELPDDIPESKDYISDVKTFASLVMGKIYGMRYDSGELKPCEFYQKNDKVEVVGIKDRKKLNKKCSKVDSESEKGLVYADHYGIRDELEAETPFEQKLFYWYCFDNNSKNTKAGKA